MSTIITITTSAVITIMTITMMTTMMIMRSTNIITTTMTIMIMRNMSIIMSMARTAPVVAMTMTTIITTIITQTRYLEAGEWKLRTSTARKISRRSLQPSRMMTSTVWFFVPRVWFPVPKADLFTLTMFRKKAISVRANRM